MRFGRKSKATVGGGSGAPATPLPERQDTNIQLAEDTGANALPGNAGYPSGPRTPLPTFFMTRRPDGKPDTVIKRKRSFG
jgi:hypothetical protein